MRRLDDRRDHRYVSAATVSALSLVTILFFGRFLFPKAEELAIPFLNWMTFLREGGLIGIYDRVEDQYGPGTYLMLTLANWIADTFKMAPYPAFKLVQFGFVVATLLVGAAVSGSLERAQLLVLLVATNSVIFGSLDILNTPFLLYAFWALGQGRHGAFAAAFVASCLCKYQPLVFAPIIAACLLRRLFHAWKASPHQAARLVGVLALPTVVLFGLSFVFFGLTWPLSGMRAVQTYTGLLSGYALNLHWLLGFVEQLLDGRLAAANGMIALQGTTSLDVTLSRWVLYATMLGLVVAYLRRPDTPASLYGFSAAVFLAYYMIPTTVLANHLQAVLPPLFLLATHQAGRSWLTFWGLNFSVSLILFLIWPHSRVFLGVDISVPLAVLTVGAFGLYLVQLLTRDDAAPTLADEADESSAQPLAASRGRIL